MVSTSPLSRASSHKRKRNSSITATTKRARNSPPSPTISIITNQSSESPAPASKTPPTSPKTPTSSKGPHRRPLQTQRRPAVSKPAASEVIIISDDEDEPPVPQAPRRILSRPCGGYVPQDTFQDEIVVNSVEIPSHGESVGVAHFLEQLELYDGYPRIEWNIQGYIRGEWDEEEEWEGGEEDEEDEGEGESEAESEVEGGYEGRVEEGEEVVGVEW